MNRTAAFLLAIALWAAIYLPGLGSTELKGEEGRRIFPAMEMLKTGNWVVPYVGGKPFLRKPPLVNWAIAGSFCVFGQQNEWSARLPSALAMLALALTVIALSGRRGWMDVETAFCAAVVILVQVTSAEKGRLAEIEAIYLALSGIAIVFWLAYWTEKRSSWLLWTVPFVFLGLGLLAKGPMHLVYFYGIVIAVAAFTREWRRLLHPAHLLGVALMLAIFAAWYIPYHRNEATHLATKVWQDQFTGRLTGSFDWKGWALNIPRALSNHLPWILFAPLLWRKDLDALGERDAAIFRGTRLALVIGFFGLLLLPGVLPRYTLPLLAPLSLLLAVVVADPRLTPPASYLRVWWRANTYVALLLVALSCIAPVAFAVLQGKPALSGSSDTLRNFAGPLIWPLIACSGAIWIALAVFIGRRRLARPAYMAAASGALMAGAIFLYAALVVPLVNRKDLLRPTALSIDSAIVPPQTLWIYDPNYQPAIFYLQTPYRYATSTKEIPMDAKWILARAEKLKKLNRAHPDLEVVQEIPMGDFDSLVLLEHKETAPQ